jgi:hypothetical protein
MHLLYLAQPFFQFVALMAVLLVLGRCSPLSPSTDKGAKFTSASSLGGQHTAQAIQNAEDEDIKRELKDLRSSDDLAVVSQNDFSARTINGLDTEIPADLADVQAVFRTHAQHALRRSVPLLVLHLTKEQGEAFFHAGTTRVDLSTALAKNMAPEVRRAYFGEIHKLMHGDLVAKAYLVLANEDISPDSLSTLPISPKFQLAIFPSDDQAYLQVSRGDQAIDNQQQKLIESNKDKALSLSIVLQ